MKTNELRIGNHIGLNLEEFKENYFTMVEVAEHACVVTDGLEWHPNRDRQYFECSELEGIPLTEEWLLKFGFKRQNNAWNSPHKDNDFSLWNPKGESEFTLNDTIHIPRVEYVHQLQNLYFALTGSELTLNTESK